MNRWSMAAVVLVALVSTTACNRYQVIPDELKGKVDQEVGYEQVKQSPASYTGRLVVLGGEVLSAKRLEGQTQIEVLQLPLTDDLVPTTERTESQGRFLAVDQGTEIDPAVVKEGTPVTIIGEVQPPTTGRIGESEYTYPTLAIRDMTVWDKESAVPRPYPYYGYYYGYGYRPYYFWSGSRVRS
ncbi:Slp family lipoprotein [Candidatus Nitrospira bockiana]